MSSAFTSSAAFRTRRAATSEAFSFPSFPSAGSATRSVALRALRAVEGVLLVRQQQERVVASRRR